MRLIGESGEIVELSSGFRGGSDFFDLIDFLKISDDGRNSRPNQLFDFFKNYMIYGFAPNYNKHIADKNFDLAANLLNEINKLSIDPLTGLRQRSFLERKLDTSVIDFNNSPSNDFSYIMCDLDNFKSVNDDFSHSIGDDTLNLFGKIILENLRTNDVGFRYGGEEFSILLPETNLESAIGVAERIRKCIDDRLVIGHHGSDNTSAHDLIDLKKRKLIIDSGSKSNSNSFLIEKNITCSFGVSSYTESCYDTDNLKDLADSALYNSKKAGRNKVMFNTCK